MTVRAKLIDAGVKNLKEFGYPTVDKDNILTDYVFKRFFISMLNDNLNQGYDTTINDLLQELQSEAR